MSLGCSKDYNLEQKKWNIWRAPPSPISMMPKWSVFAPSRLRLPSLGGGRGLIAPILTFLNETSGPPLPPISMMPEWRVFVPSRFHHCFGGKGVIN